MSDIKRRDFIKGAVASVVTAGIFSAPNASAQVFCNADKIKWDETLDTVIIGSGFAGLTAACHSKLNGTDPVIFEKRALVGGNSVLSTAWLNAAETTIQRDKFGIMDDSHELHYQDTMKGGDFKNDPAMVKKLTDEVTNSVEWLKSIGAPFPKVIFMGGAVKKRAHAVSNEYGGGLVKLLYNKTKELKIPLRKKTNVLDFVIVEDKNGVKEMQGLYVDQNGKKKYVRVKRAVIVATGGFGGSAEMVERYDPSLKGYATTNFRDASTGEAMVAAMDKGADTAGINYIQIHPTLSRTESGKGNILITEGLRGTGFILINNQCKRFVMDLDRRDVVSAAILQQPQKYAILIGSQETYEGKVADYIKLGLAFEANTLQELAQKVKLDPAALADVISEYNGYVKAGKDPQFNRRDLTKPILTAPFYAIPVQPAIHHTMGGLRINTEGQVVDVHGNIIRRMYAAGEVTGGIHGTNRLGGNAVADCLTFGRLAAQRAAQENA
ncbi:MAG: flavocytochrome c [Deferribacterales bacterium]